VLGVDVAQQLKEAGLTWKPAPGDRFAIPDRDLDDELFVLSNMTIQVYNVPEGRVIGFNGTTEWALDSVVSDEAVWLPRETQLRELLATAFRGLDRAGDDWQVRTQVNGTVLASQHPDAEQAYGLALLHLLTSR
jgi:hypothetical protein